MRKSWKVIGMLALAVLMLCLLCSCEKSSADTQLAGNLPGGYEEDMWVTDPVEPEPVSRTTTCYLCRGKRVCNNCDGECFRDGRRCRSCDGEGDCRVCLGKGRLEIMEIDGKDYINCGSCHGEKKCKYCDGTGQDEYWGACYFCKGKKTCVGCNGKGVKRLSGF